LVNKIVVFFSSLKEANSLLFQSKLKFDKESNLKYVSKNSASNIDVYITGVGYKDTLDFFKNFETQNDTIYFKIGVCGVIDPNEDILKVFTPSSVSYDNEEIEIEKIEVLEKIYLQKKLLTLREPLFDEQLSANYRSIGYSFVDMETFFVCKKTGAYPILAATDRCNDEGKKFFFKNLHKASSLLKDFFEQEA